MKLLQQLSGFGRLPRRALPAPGPRCYGLGCASFRSGAAHRSGNRADARPSASLARRAENTSVRPDNAARGVARLILLAVVLFAFVACGAAPRPDDVARIQQEFLVARFHAPLRTEFAGRTDLELFRMVCAENRVRCEPVLEMLKKSDPAFYERLHNNTTQPPKSEKVPAEKTTGRVQL